MTAIRVLVVDDHQLFREGVHALLDSLPSMRVVGEADCGADAIEAARTLAPDVILMDVQMPDMNGLEATRRILGAQPSVGIIVVTMFEDDETVFAAMRAGAKGYVLKGAGQEELVRAILAVARGEALYGPRIAARILQFFQASRRDLPLDAFPDLTEREREVLEQIAKGLGNAAIARRLAIADKTVRNHVSSIFSKLHVTDRAQAVVRAREAGFGQRDA
jgi:DNA-binding NarL/FixJ family response regulator